MKKNHLTSLALLASALPAFSTVSVTFGGGALYDSSENVLSSGNVVVVVANTNGFDDNSFPEPTDMLGATLGLGDTIDGDTIVSSFTVNNAFGPGTFNNPETFTAAAGTQLAYYWFEGVTDPNAALTAGTNYGFFRSDSLDGSGTQALVTPVDGSAGAFIFYTEAAIGAGGSTPSESFYADLTVVPEPSGVALLGLGAVAGLFRRRRS